MNESDSKLRNETYFTRKLVAPIWELLFGNGLIIIPGLFPSQFMALLGLFKDSEPLTSEAVNMDRVWKTSKFAGYGSNFGLLLSSCGSNRCVELWMSVDPLNVFSIICLRICPFVISFLKHFSLIIYYHKANDNTKISTVVFPRLQATSTASAAATVSVRLIHGCLGFRPYRRDIAETPYQEKTVLKFDCS